MERRWQSLKSYIDEEGVSTRQSEKVVVLSMDCDVSYTSGDVVMCSSRKNPKPPHGRSSEIPRRRGGLRSQNFRSKVYKAKL